MSCVDITGDGGVVKEVLHAGDGPLIKKGFSVKFYFIGKLQQDNTIFADRYKTGDPLVITAGEEQTIDGLDKALLTMREGEKANITVSAKYGYGSVDNPHGFHGSGVLVPANSSLVFENFTVIDVMDPSSNKSASNTELLTRASKYKEEGNTSFKQRDFLRAITKYRKVSHHSPCQSTEKQEQNQLLGER
eukprot:TRINITY_DN1977_c0_g1_i1.p1 TRINITY_DN1977_c0_g1~~TRINITY_DN1977_c0_g1_i1.p1  ORF type:complete len:190 (-),score=35.25 TRINITY_DN1977_c0_g1_i1:551-1120(-)